MGLRPTQGDEKPHGPATTNAVILSEALRRSIENKGLYSAESKDPGDDCWQVLFEAFRPQTTREIKKVTASERSRGICSSADLSWKCFSRERLLGFARRFGPRTPHGTPGQVGRTWGIPSGLLWVG
jgi:hypothetical protein